MNNPDSDTYFSIFNCSKHYKAFMSELFAEIKGDTTPQKYTSTDCQCSVSSGNHVTFLEGVSKQYHAEFLCLYFFDLYQIVNETIRKYVYFELYFDDKTLGVLMRKSKFSSSNLSLPCFDLDRREWAEAKIQMRMWSQYVRPETEEIEEIPVYLEHVIDVLQDAKKSTIEKEDTGYQKTIETLFANPFLWPIMAYTGIMSLAPFIPSHYMPSHTLNLYHTDGGNERITQLMRGYLDIFSLVPEATEGEGIIVVNQFKATQYQSSESTLFKFPEQLNLVLFLYSNTAATQDCTKVLHLFADSKRRNKLVSYPLKSIRKLQ